MPDYERILNSSINFVEKRLTVAVSCEQIADNAGFSLYHFMRVFQAFTGYTLKEYLRERRLSEAAKELLEGEMQVKLLAGKYGFKSAESFIRAFKKQFGETPLEYKKKNQLMNYTPKLELQIWLKKSGGKRVNYKVKEMDEMKVWCLAGRVKHGDDSIKKMWKQLFQILSENEIKAENYLSICPYDERFVEAAPEAEDEFNYMVGLRADSSQKLPAGLQSYSIKPATYAVFQHQPAQQSLADTYRYISCEWISKVDYEWAKGDELELFGADFEPEKMTESNYEIYIPIKK
ncbi:MAG: helix-turn-helix domain-containing protein [Candidatus Cloacimonadales bacterium]